MRRVITALGYMASASIAALGMVLLANNTHMLPSPTGDGLPETIAFSIGIILAGLGALLYQYKKSKGTKYLLYALSLFSVVVHSAIFAIRTHPNASMSNSGSVLLIVFLLLNGYLFYLSYKHYRNA